MVLNSLFPVFALVLLGNVLKHHRLTNDAFLKTSDRLVYYIFFPAMLFWKIGGAPSGADFSWSFCLAALCALICTYLMSLACIKGFGIIDFQAGSFSQSCFRFNTYIGMAIIINALGEAGVRYFGILIGVIIPTINVLAVSTLIWFSGRRFTLHDRIRVTTKALVSNPLIIACVAGVVYARAIGRFPIFLDNTLRLTSLVTLPLALLSIGGALTFSGLKGHFKVSLMASTVKLLFFPLIGYGFLRWFAVTGLPFKVGMIFFTLPASTAIYVLSSQLNSDTDLASSAIVLSTLLSFVSISAALILFF